MEREFLDNFVTKMRSDGLFENFVASIRAGNNKLYLRQAEETLLLEDSWIDTIDNVLYSIELISKNPRKFIKEEESIVDVERARRTTAKTVRHLASHTRNIRTIESDGNVVPRKVLTTELLEDVAIYENRFVGALVHRIFSFVEKRRDAIGEHIDTYVNTALNVNSKFRYGGNEMSYKLELNVKEPPRDPAQAERLKATVEKIDTILKRLKILLGGEFMKEIDKSKPVRPPIQKTNMIRLQQDYRNCYQLWLFLASFTSLGYSVEVKDKTLPVEGDYFDDLTVITGLSMQALLQNGTLNRERYEAIDYSEPVRKDFKNLSKIEFETDFKYDKTRDDDVVNEYYYQQMKNAFRREAKRPDSDEPALQEKEMHMSFMRYFRAVSKVNDLMYRDLIDKQCPRASGKTPLAKKEAEVERQKILLQRMKQLNKLKLEDLERTQKQEKKELANLERAKSDVEKERVRAEKARIAAEQKARAEKQRKEELKLAKERARAQLAAEALAKKDNSRIAREAVAAQRAAEERERARVAKLAEQEKAKAKLAEEKEQARLAKLAEKTKAATEASEQKRKEKEKLARQNAAATAAEKVKLAKQREKERAAKQKAAEIAAEKERIAKLAEKERLAKEKAAAAEKVRLAKEREKERAAKQKAAEIAAEKERIAKLAEKERLAKEKAAAAEKEKLAKQREKERAAKQKAAEIAAEKERIAKLAEKERLAKEKAAAAEKARLAKERESGRTAKQKNTDAPDAREAIRLAAYRAGERARLESENVNANNPEPDSDAQ